VDQQAYLARDVVARNDDGREVRGWLRAIVPLYQDTAEVEPGRTRVTRRQAEQAGPFGLFPTASFRGAGGEPGIQRHRGLQTESPRRL
jgi:hypothetical protein